MARTVFITGGTGSVGQSLVRRFAAEGYRVVFQYHANTREANALKNETGAEGVAIDFGNAASPKLDEVDILINNAAINISRSLTADVSTDDWNNNLQVNLTWPFLLAKMLLPHMVQRKWGRIINISSIYGLRACEGNLPYTVSKHGLSALTKTIAKEYGSSGISANEICPGPIESTLLASIAEFHALRDGTSVGEYLSDLVSEIPSGRLAVPEDIAGLALFLASEEAGYINGVSIPVDGGLIA